MELTSEIEVVNTRKKLKLLEETYEASQKEPDSNAAYQQLSRRSLKRMINQMKEEIARFEAHAAVK